MQGILDTSIKRPGSRAGLSTAREVGILWINGEADNCNLEKKQFHMLQGFLLLLLLLFSDELL
jgi:hypothetical protein